MMRVRLSLRRAGLFLAFFALALVALFPMRIMLGALGLGAVGLSVREVQGSVWHGKLKEVRFGAAALGDVDAGLNFFPLFVGRARIDASRAGEGGDALQGALSVTRHTLGLDDATMRLPAAAIFAPLPVSAVDLGDVSVRFREGVCDRAEGLVRAELQADVPGLSLPGGMSGTARCDGGALLLPLASQSGMEMLALRIVKNGGYTADFTVRSSDPAVQQALQTHGFAPSGDGLKLSVAGQL
ncbi:type II secretion system protein N (GspN) [Sphingomonas laterariae]|uniref:Type II secretion system protein N n=1 Tax=Edaphosphingomonas laterariae TaxID=861865 RepID=A0A239B9I4_9SPHN|nr:type II secretion system protein N [Sphingomonas laterariae]SNS04607.1 type II secretion system protein N (GspN) [Sphingomonas laterariae]